MISPSEWELCLGAAESTRDSTFFLRWFRSSEPIECSIHERKAKINALSDRGKMHRYGDSMRSHQMGSDYAGTRATSRVCMADEFYWHQLCAAMDTIGIQTPRLTPICPRFSDRHWRKVPAYLWHSPGLFLQQDAW